MVITMEGNIHSHAVMHWPDPVNGRTIHAYTPRFMKRNANIKWKRVQRIKPEYVDRINEKATKLLSNKNKVVADSAAIISIITKTGLRPGSIAGFEKTKNRGVSTLSKENVTINGDRVIINFVGKSYMNNNAEIVDKTLADYLSKRMNETSDDEFILNATPTQITKVFDKVGRKGLKVKDIRTFTATKMAKDILENDTSPPPPLPETKKDIKNVVKTKLDLIFNQVSQRLNNTPAMAKSSYVHPKIIHNWLNEMGVEPVLVGYKQ